MHDIQESYEKSVKSQENDKNTYLYVGNILLHNKKRGLYNIIDGQQRITTFALLLLAIYARLHELEVDVQDYQEIQQALWKDNRCVIELASVDKKIVDNLFKEGLNNPKQLKQFIERTYKPSTQFDENVKNNFLIAYEFVVKKYADKEDESREIINLAKYILNKVYLIVLISKYDAYKTFSIFEAINSKGKKLEEIDLIKTQIFSQLEEKDYSRYLEKWGELIIQTDDKLYEYFKIYLRANIKYYKGNISCKKFQQIGDGLRTFFNKDRLGEAYKACIDDMLKTIEQFKALFDFDVFKKIVVNNKVEFYYTLFLKLQYEHPRALFYRCFCACKDNKLSEEDLNKILIETIKFCISFLTISANPSKSAIDVFFSIFKTIYPTSTINSEAIIYEIQQKMKGADIDNDSLKEKLKRMDVYDKNTMLGVAVASIFEEKYNGTQKISWHAACAKLSTYGSKLSLNHRLVQTPDMYDVNLKYYQLGNKLKLKDGHDFPEDIVQDGMEYESFKSQILHRAGNLELKGKDRNAAERNISNIAFCSYSALEKRNDKVCNFFVEKILMIENASNYTPKESIIENSKTLTGNFNFSMRNLDLTKVKVKHVTIVNKTVETKKLIDILISIVSYVYTTDKNKLLQMAKNEWVPDKHKTKILSTKKDVLRRAYEFKKDEIYLEINLSAKSIWTISGHILDEFEIEREKVSIYIPNA